MASANGHFDIVELLIQNGADVNVANTEKNTPLVRLVSVEVVVALLL